MRKSIQRFTQKVIGEAGVRLLSTIFVLLLAHALGAEDFGRYSTAMAYASICIVFVDLGTNWILTREISRHPEERIRMAEASQLLKLVAALVSWLILLAFTFVLRFSPEQRYITLCLGVVVIGYTLSEYCCALLTGMEEMGWEAALKVLSRVLGVALGIMAILQHRSLKEIVTLLAIGVVISYGVSAWIMRHRLGSFGLAVDVPFLKVLLTSSLPVFASVMFWILYDSQDVLLLNAFHFPQRDIGCFSAAMKIVDIVRVYPALLMGVFFPTLSRLHLSNPGQFHDKKKNLLFFMIVSLAFISAAVYLMAPWIIHILYKDDFNPAVQLLRALAPALIIMGLNHAHIQFLLALNRERRLFFGAFFASFSNVGFAWFFLPRFGVTGTCYSLLASEMIYFIFLRIALRKDPQIA